jgi:transposase
MHRADPTVTPTGATPSSLISGRDPGWGLSLVLLALLGWLVAENRRLQAKVAELEAGLNLERAKRFGRSSERTPSDSTLAEESAVALISANEAEILSTAPAITPAPSPRRRGGQPGHPGHGRTLPPHLPRQEIVCDLSPADRCCASCGQPYAETSLTEDSAEIDIQVRAYVRRYRRKRYRRSCACAGTTFITAPVPPKLIPKGKFSAASWVKFLLDKYQFQLPVARQVKQLAQLDLALAESTLHGGFQRLADYLLPLYEAFLTQVRTATHLHADETRWQLFEEVEGKISQRWWLWVFASRPARVVVFVLDPSRSAKVPKKTLSVPLPQGQPLPEGAQLYQLEDQTYLLNPHLTVISADRLRVYQAISDLIQVAFCWSHQRRDFVDFGKAYAHQPLLRAWADSWVEEIGQLYALNDARLAVRNLPDRFQPAQAKLEAAVTAMQNRTFARQGLLPAQEKILLSLQRHWAGLTLFVANPDIPMDNNWAERLIRLAVLGRNNYYGHHARWSGELAAMVFSLIETCHLNHLNPFHFLLAYFTACAEHGRPPSDLTPFLPWLKPPPPDDG